MTLLEELQRENLEKEEQVKKLERELKLLKEELAKLKVEAPVEEVEIPRWKKYLPYIIGGGIVFSIIYLIFKK